MHHGKEGGVDAAHQIRNALLDLLLGEGKLKGNGHVKDEVAVRVSAHHTKIVHTHVGVQLEQKLGHALAQSVDLAVVGHDGIHVNGGLNAAFPTQALLNVVDHVVREEDVLLSVHLNVQGRDDVPRTVIVHRQIVNAKRLGVFGNHGVNGGHRLLGGGFAENGVFGLVEDLDARNQNEDRHDHAHVCIQIDRQRGKEQEQQRGQKHRGGGENVREAVGGGRAHHGRVDAGRQAAVKEAEPELDENGKAKHRNGDPTPLGRRWREDLSDRLAQQLKTDQKDQEGDDHRGHVFDPRVTEGMLAVGRLCRDAEGDQRDDLRARVGKVVHGVGHDGDRARERAHEKLGDKEQKIEQNARNARQRSVAAAHTGLAHVFVILHKKAKQKIGHAIFPFSAGADGVFPVMSRIQIPFFTKTPPITHLITSTNWQMA